MSEFSYFDRDLSWLSFNYRVLEEARDSTLPVYERIKFLGIFSSNLDEFFRIRVASIKALVKLDKKKLNKRLSMEPSLLLAEIKKEVNKQQQEYGQAFKEILDVLHKNKIVLQMDELNLTEHKDSMRHYFKSQILAYLQPIFLSGDPEEVPFLENRHIYLVVAMEPKQREGQLHYAIVNIPSDHISRFHTLTSFNGVHYLIMIDDIIRQNLNLLFPDYHVIECRSIKLNRNDDLNIENEYQGDLIAKIRKQLTKRGLGAPSRFLYDQDMSREMLRFITSVFGFSDEEVVEGGRYHNMYDLMGLPNPVGQSLENLPLKPISVPALESTGNIFDLIQKRDLVLHFPYHSYDYVLQFFNEAAVDPYVTRIRATFYRVAPNSVISSALISAAKNGKKVNVFFEVKARFDEGNNLRWAEKMKDAGIKIMYSIPGIKVHAKVALVDRIKDGQKVQIGFYGTGNFNEKTASIYADHCLLTRNPLMNKELVQVFAYLKNQKPGFNFKLLLVSQFNIVDRLTHLIDREIEYAKSGRKGQIILKLNNIEDPTMIDKLYEASNAGVQIQLLIRSICRVIPGVKGMSENIKVTRLLDRYLEHARILHFHNNGDDELYMGSADWMVRNLYHRVEVVFPIYDPQIKQELKKFLAFQLRDNTKARILDSKHHNNKVLKITGKHGTRAQTDFYQWLSAQTTDQEGTSPA